MRTIHALIVALAMLVFSPPASRAQVVELVDAGVSGLVAPGPFFGNPVYYYTTVPICLNTLGDESHPARISRGSIYLFAPRPIFDFNPARPPGTCNPYRILSDTVSDEDFVYYVDNQGPDGHAALWRRDLFANPSDDSQLLVDLGASLTSAQVILYQQFLFALLHRPGRPDLIVQYDKATGALINSQVFGSPADTVSEMQVDSRFLYWKVSGRLRRNDLTNGNQVTVLNGPLSGYYLEGYDEICGPPGCQIFDRLLFGQDNVLYEAETLSGSVLPLYTSPHPGARIMSITRDGTRIYFFERRPVGAGFDREDRLFRLIIGNTVPDLIYGPVNNGGPGFDGLTTDLIYLYFRDRGAQKLLRLPNDAAAIPVQDMEATGIEVTQGLQNAANQLRLIQNKRTIVRFYVRSKIAYRDVPGVTAVLQASSQRGFLGTLDPINSGGKLLTVHYFFDRNRLDYSFQFELPLAWTTEQGLHLTATVNPGGRVVEDNLSDNTFDLAVQFAPSQRLYVGIINFNYPLDGPMHFVADADWAASQRRMRRLYPISEPDRAFGGPGLHFATANVCDFGLTPWVARNHPDCVKRYKDPKDRNMCASDYVHAQLAWMRVMGVLREPVVYYGNIAQAPDPPGGSYFTRGYANGQQGSGPSTDVNYAAHEVGHVLGRPHPSRGATECGHTASDDNYPYFRSLIDDSNAVLTRYAGIDFADTLPGNMMVLDAQSTYDTMSYCSPNWISDYTTNAMYNFLLADPLGQIQLGAAQGAAGPIEGDWLILAGTLNPTEGEGGFTVARRTDSVTDDTAPVAGGFTLELRDAADGVLATHGFTANPIDEQPGRIGFDLVVPFAAGTANLRVVDDATTATLATLAVSENPPTVADVALPDAPDPVDGTVTVTWSASDPDGDALRFDLLASRDGGATYRAVLLGIEGTEVALDTTMLGGGTNQLRIVASDGVQTGYADSAPFTVPARAPKLVITAPVDGFRADWNQILSFEAEIQDVQDTFFDDTQISWSNQDGALGTGRLIQTDQLRIGENTVTVTATNSLGVSGSASITVIVGDRLIPPGPTLSVAPQMIAWHIEDGDSAAQVASLSVENAGGGDLTFDVASGAPWLLINSMLGVSGATAPADFIISADPTLVPPGTTSEASLTFQSLADPNDVVVVPVSLSRGNVFDHTGDELVIPCAGDCDASGAVSVDELVRGVNIALDRAPVSLCEVFDSDSDGRVTVSELVGAVNAALRGC